MAGKQIYAFTASDADPFIELARKYYPLSEMVNARLSSINMHVNSLIKKRRYKESIRPSYPGKRVAEAKIERQQAEKFFNEYYQQAPC